MRYQLIIANKNYSSWSLRPWLVLTHFKLPFSEQLIWLGQPDSARQLTAVSPSGRVPVLIDGALRIHDSLAIVEYLAEQHPDLALWPRAQPLRALARAACAEMHAGFTSLRSECPMHCQGMRLPVPPKTISPTTQGEAARIQALWADLLQGSGGPFLAGEFSIVDAFFAPVVTRFKTYRIPLNPHTASYAEQVLALPAMQAWLASAYAETSPYPASDAALGLTL